MGKGKDFFDTIIRLITFSDMHIKKKFLLFSLGVGVWFALISSLGFFGTENVLFKELIIASTLIATTLLVIFSINISLSFTKPLTEMTNQIRSLSDGDILVAQKIEILSEDEIGELSESFNRLLDSIHDMRLYRKVIEEDDTADDIYKRLGNTFANIGLNSFQIYEVANSKNAMRPMFASDESVEDTCSRDTLVNCNLCRAKKTGDLISSLTYPGICKHFLIPGNKHHICIPMIIGDSTGGVTKFLFPSNTTNEEVSPLVIRAHKYIKESLPVLEAKRLMDSLKESSLRDAQTGLYNRRFLEEYSDTLVATTNRRKTNMGILMCDLDYFKEVNDTYGHNIGDVVLKATATALSESIRASDMIIRFGGEEFLAILQDADEGEANNVAEKIRNKIEETKIKIPRGFIQKTISVGISEFPKDTVNFWQAIKYADIALYKAKDSGRNQTVRFSKDMWTQEEY